MEAAEEPDRRELLATVAAQEEQLREYQARLRDLVRAHKGLLAERAALEAGLAALAGSAAEGPAEGEPAAAGGGPEARLGAALATLAREKARLEASWQAERRGARAERERLEGEAREARARLAAQQRDRAQEQADHADMLRELQRLLQDERARRREAELGLEEARREEPRELRAELECLRGHFQAQLLQEAGKAAQADEHLRMGEQRGAALEARISEMSELLGAYEKARQKDQAALQKLKDRLLQLDLENKTLAIAASGHATVGLTLEDGRLDANVLRDKVEKLTELARVAAEHTPSLVGDGQAVCPEEPPKDAETGDGEKATLAYYQQELKQLKEEFERYKVRAQVVLKNKSAKDGNLARELEESQEQLVELKEKYVSLRLSCEVEAKQHQEQLEAKRREAALFQQLHRQELERCLSEGREKALQLEEEMHKQRDRALAVLMEKDQELQQLRVLSVPFGVQAPKTATGPGNGGSGSAHSDSGVGDDALEHLTLPLPAPNEPTFLLYTEQLARKEVEILALKKQKHQLEMEVHQLQEKLMEEGEKHREELSLLQGHIQKTFRDRSREGANLEYLKNIFYRAPFRSLASVCSNTCAKCGQGHSSGLSSLQLKPANKASAIEASPILVLVWIYLVTLSLSLLGSASILAMVVRRRQCCCNQLRPLVLLSLADFLGAAVLIPTMAIHLLPTQHFGAAHGFCLYGRMFGMMFYAISLLMVLVYAWEVNRAVRGWRVTQDNSPCCLRFQLALPYTLAWLLPCLVVLALMVLRSSGPLSSEALLQPLPQAGHNSSGALNLSCSSCLILIHLSHNSCYKTPRQPGPLLSPQHLGKESSIFFLAFVVVVVSACVVLYCRVKRWPCRDCHGLRSEGGLASRSRVSRSFQLVLVLCWMPACLLVMLSFTGLQLSTLFPLLVATALTAPLQGFLHSLVYGWLRGSFRQEVAGERFPLYCSPDLKATFDDSLAASGYPWKPSAVHK